VYLSYSGHAFRVHVQIAITGGRSVVRAGGRSISAL